MAHNISINQIRAARALLRLSSTELANISGLAPITLRKLESETIVSNPREETLFRLKTALESRGIEFLGTPEKDPGVRLKSLKKNTPQICTK